MRYDKEQILSNNPIENVVGELVDLKKEGPDLKGCCPFHDEKSASFVITPAKGLFNCFGCGAGGDVIKFVELYYNVDFKGALEKLGKDIDLMAAPATFQAKKEPVKDIYEGYKKIVPAPMELLEGWAKIHNPKKVEDEGYSFKNWDLKRVFPYTTSTGAVSHYVVRIEIEDKQPKGATADEGDPCYFEAVSLVVEKRKCSISFIQRGLRIGYNRAANLVQQMEEEKIVSKQNGSGQRGVIVPADYENVIKKINKITPTVYWCELPDGESSGWTLFSQDNKRPLYNLHNILSNPDATICIVEGEKAAQCGIDNTFHLSERYVFTCWPGGTNGRSKADFSPLTGRKVILIPDYDVEGYKALKGEIKGGEKVPGVIDYLKEAKAESIKFCFPEKDSVKGWDIADKEWKQGELADWVKANGNRNKMQKHPLEKEEAEKPKKEPNTEKPPGLDHDEIIKLQQPPESEVMDLYDLKDAPFRVLGYNKDLRYYMPHSTQQIVELTPPGHSKGQLMALAPLSYWLEKFGDGNRTGKINWDSAADRLLQMSTKAGLFDKRSSIRGRGAWLDEGRSVLHLGEKVYLDGEKIAPEDVESRFIYEKNHNLAFDLVEPAGDEAARKLVELLSGLTWENQLSAFLLAGWCVIAPVCGILNWRSHVWVTGPSGSGKSTAIDLIVKVILGKFSINTEGVTTEAGIRQSVGQDARPVIYDEAEGEDKEGVKRMQSILNLARVSSSGGSITKGSSDGEGVVYCVRSCFLFAAINPSIKHLADENRISQLVLKHNLSPTAEEDFEVLLDEIEATIDEDYSAALFARSMDNLDVLVHNAKVFKKVCARAFKNARAADQIGTLLAGCYLCFFTEKVTPEAAKEWINKYNWADHNTGKQGGDLERLLGKIGTHRIYLDNGHTKTSITIAEAVLSACGKLPGDNWLNEETNRKACFMELKRSGILCNDMEDSVTIATFCNPMQAMLEDTAWTTSYPRVLMEHKEAKKSDSAVYFTGGIRSRGVTLPVSIFSE